MNRRPLCGESEEGTVFATWYSKTTTFPSFFPLRRPYFRPQEKINGKGKLSGSPSWHGYDICWLDAVNKIEGRQPTKNTRPIGTWKYQPFFRGDDQKIDKTCLTEISCDCWEFWIENSMEPFLQQISSKQEYPGSHYHHSQKNQPQKQRIQ